PHDDRDLGYALCGPGGLAVEDVAEVFLVREYFVLLREVGTTGINQVDAGQPVFFGDGLGANVLFDGQRVIGAALDGGIVGQHQAFDAANPSDAGDDAGRRHPILVN